MIDAGLFARHLDLAPLRGRGRGLVRCIFHAEDRRPSLSVDLDRGLFHCFTCGRQGGMRAFAALVGEAGPQPAPAPRPETEWQRAWREIQQRNLAEAQRRAESAPVFFLADWVRRSVTAVTEARRLATTLGPEDPRTWALLERAARVEREALTAEAELDALAAAHRRPA